MPADIPTLTTVDEATALMRDLATQHEWVAVFWDRGWGDSGQPLEISIIVDGDGQCPKAFITREVYTTLLDQRTIQPNSYGGYKARRLHDYQSPPEPDRDGPDPLAVVETAIRRLLADIPDEPIRARFFRGFTPGPRARAIEEFVDTPACVGGWYVLLCPGGDINVAISAQEPTVLGPAIIGRGIADCLRYPCTADGEVDLDALAGPQFRADLLAAIQEKLAVIANRKAEVAAR